MQEQDRIFKAHRAPPPVYLPHHRVLHPHKPGRVRRVSDAAAEYQRTSLNEHLSS